MVAEEVEAAVLAGTWGPVRLLFAAVPFLLFGCGGSGGTAGGGIGGSGITVSAVSVGSVASFGSIIVNDVEFDTTNAEVVVEGEVRGTGDAAVTSLLSRGMVVRVEGRLDGERTGTAARVVFNDNVEGPVESITALDAIVTELVVMGQTVRVDDRVAHHTLVAEAPDDPHPVTLGPADAEALTAALAAYGSGEREHACPLCGSNHDFPHALACERAEGVFARSARPVLSAWRAAATGRIALLPGASWAAIPLPDAAVVWLGDVAVVWGPDGAHQLLVPDGQVWRPRDLETVWPGMERDRVTGILVATCSVEGAEATR